MPPPMQMPVQPPVGESWPTRSVVTDQTIGGTTYINVKANNGPHHPNKLPFLHSILQKEITRPQPFSLKYQTQHQHHPMSSTVTMIPGSSPSPFTMTQSHSIYESHSTQTTPLVPVPQTMSYAQQMEQYQVNQMAMLMGQTGTGAGTVEQGIMGPTPIPMHAIHSSNVQFASMEPSMETTMPPMITTTNSPVTMTTDPFFSHYNQPEIGGAMFGAMIIEGHSKVKTYGQGDEEAMHAPKVVPVVPTEDSVITHVGSESQMVRHLHNKNGKLIMESGKGEKELKEENKETKGEKVESPMMGGLLSLIDSSLGDFLKDNEEGENSVLEFNVEKKNNKN